MSGLICHSVFPSKAVTNVWPSLTLSRRMKLGRFAHVVIAVTPEGLLRLPVIFTVVMARSFSMPPFAARFFATTSSTVVCAAAVATRTAERAMRSLNADIA